MRPRFGPFAGLSSMVGGRRLCQMLYFTMGYMLICVIRISAVVRKSRFFPSPPLPGASPSAFPTLAVCAGKEVSLAKVRLACPLTDQGPRDGPDQPRQHEGGSTKDILVIRCKAFRRRSVSASAINLPRVSPCVVSLKATEKFSDLVRRRLTSSILPMYHVL